MITPPFFAETVPSTEETCCRSPSAEWARTRDKMKTVWDLGNVIVGFSLMISVLPTYFCLPFRIVHLQMDNMRICCHVGHVSGTSDIFSVTLRFGKTPGLHYLTIGVGRLLAGSW
jgi:hypothetical protein